MYNYMNNPQLSIERIDKQISDLERIKSQIQQPAPITQNFQIAPTRDSIHYVNSIEDVQKEVVYGATPFFSKDMTVLWVKNAPNSIKSYEIKEIINKDEKDLKIEFLMAQIEDLKKGMSGSYRNYEAARNEYNTGNYGAKEDGLKELEYMLHSLVKFAKVIKEEATSPEEQEIVRRHFMKISEM